MRRLRRLVLVAFCSACSEPRNTADYIQLSRDARERDSATAARAWADSAIAIDSSWSAFEARAHANWAMGRTDDARRDFDTFARRSPPPDTLPFRTRDAAPEFPVEGHKARVRFLFETGDTLAALDALEPVAKVDQQAAMRLRTFCSGVRDRQKAAGWDHCWRTVKYR